LSNAYKNKKRELQDSINGYEMDISLNQNKIESLNDPCPNCGYIAPDTQERIKKTQEKIKADNVELRNLKDQLADLKEPEQIPEETSIPKPEYKDVPEKRQVLSESERGKLVSDIQAGREASAKISAIETRIEELETERKTLQNKEYNIDPDISDVVAKLNSNVEEQRKLYESISNELSGYKAELRSLTENRQKAIEIEDKVEAAKAEVDNNQDALEDWQYIAKLLQPARIPALELELVLDTIDTEASRIIEPFEEQRYSVYTETQKQGKKGAVDKFDIKIHDNMTGYDKSFIKWNPGHKAFFADAYTKALIQQRNNRAKRRYDPVIMDEADGPIQPERIADYYEMQRQYWTDSKVLVVSHSPASHEHIESIIKMEDVVK